MRRTSFIVGFAGCLLRVSALCDPMGYVETFDSGNMGWRTNEDYLANLFSSSAAVSWDSGSQSVYARYPRVIGLTLTSVIYADATSSSPARVLAGNVDYSNVPGFSVWLKTSTNDLEPAVTFFIASNNNAGNSSLTTSSSIFGYNTGAYPGITWARYTCTDFAATSWTGWHKPQNMTFEEALADVDAIGVMYYDAGQTQYSLYVDNFAVIGSPLAPVEVACPPHCNSNEDWWLYQFQGYEEDPAHGPFSNHNCGPACTAMVINYFKNKGVTTSYHTAMSTDHPNVHCHARWDYCEANGVSGGYPDSDWSQPGATYGQIQSVLSSEGIESHALTGSACKNDGTGIANVQGAIDQGKLCICKVAPMYYRDVGYFSHWTVVYGYDENSIYLNDPGYSAPPSGQGFRAEISRFADAMWMLKEELQVIIIVDTRLVTGETCYVDAAVAQSGDGKCWANAFKRIQQGIDAAWDGDTVIVAEGTYVENIKFNGKNIVLRSTDPLDPTVVAGTIIDGNHGGSVVTLAGTEDETCVISGFTIRNGLVEFGGGGVSGGQTAGPRTHATIKNCVVARNRASFGGGLWWCRGTIQNNTITGNSADYGSGLSECHGTIQNNTVSGNSAEYGGGLCYCGGTIQNNAITGNSAALGGGLNNCHGTIRDNTITANAAAYDGGALYCCDGTVQNNTIAGNSAGEWGGGLSGCGGIIQNNTVTGNSAGYHGGGLSVCRGTIQNNTITGNSAGEFGGGLLGCDGTIENNTVTGNSAGVGGGLCECNGTMRNCIIWANTAPSGGQLDGSSTPSLSCIQGWSGGGEGNIAGDPQFADADGTDDNPETYEDNDYRLSAGSPCVDAGINQDWMCGAVDLDGNARIADGDRDGVAVVDMGAYEYGAAGQGYVFGIDVSSFQGLIDWGSVKGARIAHSAQTFPITFALIRASKGNADSGTDCSFKDPRFDTNAESATGTEMFVAAYHVAAVVNDQTGERYSAKDEAAFFVSVAANYLKAGCLRPALDLENHSCGEPGPDLEKDGLSLSAWVDEWMTEVKWLTGVTPFIYCNQDYAKNYLDETVAQKYDLWIANPTGNPHSPADLGPWSDRILQQYDWYGNVAGIVGDVDLNVFHGTQEEFEARLVIPAPQFRGVGGGPLEPPLNGEFRFEILAPSQLQVTVQASEDLIHWADLETVLIENDVATFSDLGVGGLLKRFYRAKP